jgi:hypothetical protein
MPSSYNPLPPPAALGRPPAPAPAGSSLFAFQQNPGGGKPIGPEFKGLPPTPKEQSLSINIQFEPPGPDVIFRLETEDSLFERIRQEDKDRQEPGRQQSPLQFPREPVLSTQPYFGRSWPQQAMLVEPNYVNYGRLYFEEKNAERYGWELGPVQPVVSAAWFFKDVLALPYKIGTDPFRCYESNAGYCLPGDPVPLRLYPPGISVTGGLTEAAVIAGLIAAFP